MAESGLALDNRRAEALARKRGRLGSASTVILIGSLHIVYYIALGVSRWHEAGLLRRTEADTGQVGRWACRACTTVIMERVDLYVQCEACGLCVSVCATSIAPLVYRDWGLMTEVRGGARPATRARRRVQVQAGRVSTRDNTRHEKGHAHV
jgi:ferredoxin